MASWFIVQREEKYTDGKRYWNELHRYRSEEKAVNRAKEISGHVRVVEDDED